MVQVVKKQFISRNNEWVLLELNGELGDHVAAADPHPQYATDADAAAAAAAVEAYVDATPAELYMQGLTSQVGAPDLMPYLHAYVTLTPGSWIVQGGIGCWNSMNLDSMWGGLYDTTNGLIPMSGGAEQVANTASATAQDARSATILIKVATGTLVVHPCAWRNGGSNLQTLNGPNGPMGWVSAIRVGM
jgi:hypothetical protein